MANYTFQSCPGTTGNIFGGACEFNPDVVKAAVLVPKGAVFTNAQLLTLKTTLQANLIADTRASRWFLIGELGRFADKSEAPKEDSVDNYKTTTSEGAYDWQYDFIRAGKCAHQTLRNFNFQQAIYDVMFIDASNNIFGKLVPDTNGLPQMGGYAMHEIYAMPWAQKQIGKINKYTVRFALADVKEPNDSYLQVPLGFNPLTDVKGLLDVKGSTLTGTAGSFTGYFNFGCNATNLVTAFPSLIAAGAWTATDSTGAALTITAVALNTTLDGLVFTVTGGATTDTITIRLKATSITSTGPYNVKYVVQELANAAIGTW